MRIAELSETSSSDVEKLQQYLLKKAAELGADAVVFSSPIIHTEQGVTYQPTYSPWGYYAPYYYGPGPYGYWGPWGYHYGPWGPGWGYHQYVPVPYSVRVTTFKGIAIRYWPIIVGLGLFITVGCTGPTIEKERTQSADPVVGMLQELRALDLAGWELHRQQWILQRDHLMFFGSSDSKSSGRSAGETDDREPMDRSPTAIRQNARRAVSAPAEVGTETVRG